MVTNFTDVDVPDQSGKTFFVTGGNSGVGREVARALAKRGGRVLIGCRNIQTADKTADDIRAESPSADVSVVPLDLMNLDSVRSAAEFVTQNAQVDVLINNAGMLASQVMITPEGYEAQMMCNHLGHFALTNLLLPHMFERPNTRVVTTSSMSYRFGQKSFDAMMSSVEQKPSRGYANSKLANVWHVVELNRRFLALGVDAVAVGCHPGVSATSIMRNFNPLVGRSFRWAGRFYNVPRKAAWTALAAAVVPGLAGRELLAPSSVGEIRGPARTVPIAPIAADPMAAHRMWQLSAEITGTDLKVT